MNVQFNNYLPIIDLGNNRGQTIFLSSSARSGSTFIANLLNHNKKYRVLFEPLSKNHVARAKELDFPIFLREDDTNENYIGFFNSIINGQISNRWIDRENKAGFYRKRLIKEVRSNLLLPWTINNFSEVKVILLIRNPISVISSWNRLKFEDGFVLRELVLKEKDFLKELPSNIINEYKLETNGFLLSLYYWCMNNAFPLQNCKPNTLLSIKYEDVVSKNLTTIEEIHGFTGIDIGNVSDNVFNKTSSSSQYNKDDSDKRLQEQKQLIGEHTLEKAQHIMESFGMSELYDLNLK